MSRGPSLLVRLVLEVVEETALGLRPKPLTLGNAQTSLALRSLNRGFHLLLVEKVVSLVDDALKATAAKCLGLLTHAVIVVTLALVLRLGIDVDVQRLMAHDLHLRFILPLGLRRFPMNGNAQISAFDFPCAEGHGSRSCQESLIWYVYP